MDDDGAKKKEEEGKNLWVLVDTSLDTHMGMSLSPTTTAGHLKREVWKEHPICFPSIGGIKINGIMVKRKSIYYHLPDSIVLKDLFRGWKRTYSLHVDAVPSDQSECVATKEQKVCDDGASGKPGVHVINKVNTEDGAREGEDLRSNGIPERKQMHEPHIKVNEKRSKEMCCEKMVDRNKEEVPNISPEEESFHCDISISRGMKQGGEWTPAAIEAPSLSVSEVVSVTGLITRYFPEYDKVKSSKCPSDCSTSSETGSCASYHGSMKKPPKRKQKSIDTAAARLDSLPPAAEPEHLTTTCRGRSERPQVGKRLLSAVNGASKKKSATSLRLKLSSEALVFEISDSV